jgi:hypothetical protein
VFAEHYPVEYLGDTVESMVIALRAGCKVVQVPAHMRPRRGGTPSHRPIKSMIYLFRAGFALLLALIRRYEIPTDEPVKAAPSPVKEGVVQS